MKSWEIQGQFGLESLSLADRAEPSPGPGQVLVRTKAVSLNYRDLMVTLGKYNPRLKLPLVPCSDGAGEVIAVGEHVTRLKIGDRVTSCFFPGWLDGPPSETKMRDALGGGTRGPSATSVDGVLVEQAVFSEQSLVPIPDYLSFEEAATLPCAALTAWNALQETNPIRAGQTILTQGTGGVSLFAAQIAKLAGARVVLTSSSDDKLERAKALGADVGINYRLEPEWERRVLDATEGRGVDHVVELGGAGTLEKSFRAVRAGGVISLIGVLTGGEGQVNPISVLMRSIRLQGIYVGSRSMFENMNVALKLHSIRPTIDRVFPFAEAPRAFEHLGSGTHFGKVVIAVG
jgi:NADPH:quinone reductase-like Zn-dependent oxidoreductase